ncbi:gluconokinase [Aeromicrobium sp. Sec7.5]|uniref:gluconokinase n=1 Tax=Aeromicrobium sp. Sec7.5 TaxID=3121276 RepID=UPI002FE437C3
MTADDARPLIVAMGISGTGKSAVGRAVADRLGLPYADGDDYHPRSNIEKMSAGKPLTDEDRWPWLELVATWIAEHEGGGGVIACSALKRSYRDVLRRGAPDVVFLHLAGDHDLIQERMEKRDHFMPATLLASQESTLEPLEDDEQGWELDITPSIEEIVDEFVTRAGLQEPAADPPRES